MVRSHKAVPGVRVPTRNQLGSSTQQLAMGSVLKTAELEIALRVRPSQLPPYISTLGH